MRKRDECEEGMHMKERGSDSASSTRDKAPMPLELGRSNESEKGRKELGLHDLSGTT
jgi:hypothetical protein